jgi:hypothetical protein
VGAKPEGITRRLVIFASAFTALNLRLITPLVFDDPPGLVISRGTASQRHRTPGAKAIRLKLTFGERQQAAMAEESILLGASKVQEHLGPQPQKNPPDFFRRMFHESPVSDTLSLFPWSYEYDAAAACREAAPEEKRSSVVGAAGAIV